MEYKPSEFFVGVVDLFGILMPGAIATYLLSEALLSNAKTLHITGIDSGAPGWAAFVVGSYILGHLVFLIGSFLDFGYDPIRRLLRPLKKDGLYVQAKATRDRLLGARSEVLNPFKFARSVLDLHYAGPSREIARLEADSKFFRSLSVVLVFLFAAHARTLDFRLQLLVVVLFLLCLWRFGERRWKSTQVAYAYFLAHNVAPGSKSRHQDEDEDAG